MRRDCWRIGVAAAALAFSWSNNAIAADAPRPADAIAEKFANADAPKKTADAPATKPDRPDLDYEMDMLRRARAEAEALKAADAPKPEPVKLEAAQPDTAKPQPVKAEAAKTETPKPEPVKVESAKPVQVITAPPTAETAPVADAPAPPKPEAAAAPALTTTAKTEPPPSPAAAAAPAVIPSTGARATILLVLDREGAKSPPDPILCFEDVCAISAGLSTAASTMPRAAALAMKNTRDATTDPCFGKSACAFRDVPLPIDAILQVISIGSGEPPKPGDGFTAAPDETCKIVDGDIECGHPLATLNFTAWIVPEALAKSAGAAALESAIADGLPFSDEIQSADK